jgi:soluble lytic murein transglycosylase-like protein
MRLVVLALTALAFAQPAFAREHYRHHWAHQVHSYHHLVRAQAWHQAQHYDRLPRAAFVARSGEFGDAWRERNGAWNQPVSDHGRSLTQPNEGHGNLDAMISRHAHQNGLPEALVRRVVMRESGYKPGTVGAGGAMGLMQIKLGTAREMGYGGSAAGLLDPETNLTYAVRYLAGAYRVAGGNADRAVANYARGYRDAALRQGAPPQERTGSFATSGWSGGSGWSNSFASAGPVERVAWVHAPARQVRYRRSMRQQ